nr:MAG TPA_asm: hypothetical protein [Caudoviricetes sp.]
MQIFYELSVTRESFRRSYKRPGESISFPIYDPDAGEKVQVTGTIKDIEHGGQFVTLIVGDYVIH